MASADASHLANDSHSYSRNPNHSHSHNPNHNPDHSHSHSAPEQRALAAQTEELATFSLLADPSAIAGSSARAGVERESDQIIERLRSELLRRARQVETLSRDLPSRAPSGTAAAAGEAQAGATVEVRDEVEEADAIEDEAEVAAGVEVDVEADVATQAQAVVEPEERRREPGREAEPLQCSSPELERLDAPSYAAREIERQSERRLYSLQRELDSRTREVKKSSEECAALRRSLVELRRDAAEAQKASRRAQEALAETRGRVLTREAEASALRGALVTNQRQTQARECDNQELQAALSIAAETLQANREELKTCRTKLAEGGDEICALRSQLDESEHEIAGLRENRSQAESHRDALCDELAAERQALGQARDRAADTETTLAALRETLTSIGKAASMLPHATPQPAATVAELEVSAPAPASDSTQTELQLPDAPAKLSPLETEPETRDGDDGSDGDTCAAEPAALRDASASDTAAEEQPGTTEFKPAAVGTPPKTAASRARAETPDLLSLVPERSAHEPPAIFATWRDKQIAKKLAPLGVAGADDYFVGQIETLFEARAHGPIQILSLGGEDAEFELRIARELRRRDRDGFAIHFPEASPEHAAEIVRKASQAGLDRELLPYRVGDSGGLDAADCRAIISDGALSRSDCIEPLLEALAEAARRGTLLAVAERTGTADDPTTREMGDRIWQLMPERYKLDRVSQRSLPNYWSESESTGADAGENADLLAILRAHFRLDDFAAFGHLVDRFVSREIGPNFDPGDDRDRRFIEQIASLDETKLDAGALEPRYMVARLSVRER